ncbi:oxygenase MpaB family protein [Actinomadura sp. ATCC 31491]|uniref:Oxygenase MpaB family protein n=1 Tax=Actinomadura luzonensis TaxID=2805427 RepID=A0ABT0G1M3_9ACTN|nr:oxygenase MpaB family protein [Actinomadura luzonensis]MCK2218483.1 oxygenase MpaB family protein [Actinomadura luzonensis]
MTTHPTPQQDTDVFGPDSLLRPLVNEARWGLAVTRATVLEAAHPQIGAALMDNSTFLTHPWRRLRNTTMSSRRLLDPDPRVRDREAARLNRLHGRMSGTDAQGRPYDATDPEARAWVVATLFESTVTMCRLSGDALDAEAMRRLYAEHRTFLALLEGDAGHLPATLPEFWSYYDDVIAHKLENNEAVNVIVHRLFANVPAPPVLRGHPALWTAGRAVAGPVAAAITIASLPEAFSRRLALPDLPGARTLMQSAYLGAALATRCLPRSWTRVEFFMGLLDPSDEAASPWQTLRRQAGKAAALARLVVPAGDDDGQAVVSSAERFFTEVLDQTGDGCLRWPDLAAMAREIATRLDLGEQEEERLFQAYAAWWRELQTALDRDGDGRVTRDEYAAAAARLPGSGLIRIADVLFDATDTDDDGEIDAEEYRDLFRTAFHRDLAADGGRCSRGAFVRHFVSFMSGQRHSDACASLLTRG